MMKYKKLGFLLLSVSVLMVFTIAVAQSGSVDSKQTEVMTIQSNRTDTQESKADSMQMDAPATQPADQNTQEPNEDSIQKDVPAAQPDSNAACEPNNDPKQDDPPAPEPDSNAPQKPDAGAKQKDVSMALQQRMLKTISIDCTNTPVEDVIKMLAEQAGVDIIKSPAVTGNVTAKLTNVPLEEALNNILAVNGYGCVIDKNMIRVAPADEIAQKGEILESRVYRITYADVAQVENALKKFISKRGSISSNLGTSNIIVTDTSSSIRAIDNFISEIDRITPQVMVEARIYDVTSTDGFDIGTEWHAGRNNPITVVGTGDKSTAWQDSDAGEATSTYTFKKSRPFTGGSFDTDSGGTIRLGLLDSVNLEIELSMLRSEIGAKLLANPRILVLDNETAEFKIISEIPYTETSQTSAGGSMTSTQFKEVGVELKVKPHITRDGMVRLHIMPEFSVVSTIGAIIPNTGGARGVPTIDSRKADTTALVKDGQTVVLGGLRKRTVSQTVKKIPFLGDVPIMGNVFSDTVEEVKTNELLIFITPRIISEPAFSPRESENYKATDFSNPRNIKVGDEDPAKALK